MTLPQSQATIVLIGAPADVRATRAEALLRQGYQVLTAAHVPEAEALGQRLGLESFDLVILDLPWTPDPQVGEGSTLVQRWGAQAPQLPFMLIGDDRLVGPAGASVQKPTVSVNETTQVKKNQWVRIPITIEQFEVCCLLSFTVSY